MQNTVLVILFKDMLCAWVGIYLKVAFTKGALQERKGRAYLGQVYLLEIVFEFL